MPTTISDVRQKFPQYSDLSDEQLAQGLHRKFYSDMPFEQFAAKIGFQSAPPRFEDTIPGQGGKLYNPNGTEYKSPQQPQPQIRWSDAIANAMPRMVQPITDPMIGAAELGLSGATNLFGKIAGGTAALGQMALNPTQDPNEGAANTSRAVEDYFTYQPGARGADLAGGLARGAKAAYAKTGLPSLTPDTPLGQTLAPAVGEAAASLGPVKGIGRSVAGALDRATIPKPKPFVEPVPTTEQLRVAANRAYAESDAAGVVIKPESTQRVVTMFEDVAKAENLGKLTPKLNEAANVLRERVAAKEPLSLKDADKVRQLIGDALKSTDAGDRRLAKIIQKRYDAYIDNLKPADTLAGNTEQGVALLNQARELWKRTKNSELVDSIENRAAKTGETNYTQGGLDLALRREFLKLGKNEKKTRMMTPEQRAAVDKVAAPGRAANTLRNIGKIDPTRGGMATALNTVIGGGLGGTLGAIVGGPVAAGGGAIAGQAALGTAANLAGRAALRGTLRRVAGARESLVGRGLPSDLPVRQAQPLSGELMPRKPLALPSPTIISGQRSAPGSMYQREQMGMTPDVERAGMQHPGMARQSIPPQPRALPYLPDEPKPMVVDQAGRIAPSIANLEDYLSATGQAGLRNVRQPSANPPGLLGEATRPDASRGSAAHPRRTSSAILADMQRLAARAHFELAGEPAGSPKVRKFAQELARLQDELEATRTTPKD